MKLFVIINKDRKGRHGWYAYNKNSVTDMARTDEYKTEDLAKRAWRRFAKQYLKNITWEFV